MPARILSERLKTLEREGLVRRRVYSEHPLRAEYRLTPRGKSLAPVLQAMYAWGMAHALGRVDRARVRQTVRARAASHPGALWAPEDV
jgi:DNA-binding HxlR family transcriptional regulator